MGYEVDMWVDDYSIVPAVKSEFGSLVWYHSHRFGVPLPSPAQDLYLWDGERTAAQAEPDHGALLDALRSARLFDQLPADELDRLANAAEPARFARGELILRNAGGAPVLLQRGTARLVLRRPGFSDAPVVDFEAGDVFGVTEHDDAQRREIAVVAVTDCDVVLLRADVAAAVISRSPALADALDQLATSRHRRIQRVLRRLAAAGEAVAPAIEATATETGAGPSTTGEDATATEPDATSTGRDTGSNERDER
jgi:CRP-like cAMP-binding protein